MGATAGVAFRPKTTSVQKAHLGAEADPWGAPRLTWVVG